MDNDDQDKAKSFAVGILTDVVMSAELVRYVELIDSTIEPFGGSFLVHGDEPVVHEGTSPGSVVIIEFPNATGAVDWYRSENYQTLIPLRADNSTSTIFTLVGVSADHRATDILSR